MEIANYWDQLYSDSQIHIQQEGDQYSSTYNNYNLEYIKTIWLIIYTMFYLSVLSIVNIKKLKNSLLGNVNLGLNILVLGVFLTLGLYELSELRESYINGSDFYEGGLINIGIRYLSFVFVALLLVCSYKYIQQEFIKTDLKKAFDLVLHISILWIVSSELLHWMDLADTSQSYKLGLSILWGVYALLLIAMGIYKKKKYLRIGAIALFGMTLIKLFFYDISQLNTISKTIVFVSLGILLLIISFLYNKYKNIIADEIEN